MTGTDRAEACHNPSEAGDLTARVRALYEGSAVPVREIATIAGVTERTLYKYAAKHQWKPRYRWTADGARPRGARWQSAERVAPVKGAGGRFIRREDAGRPFATGLKATDPAGRARGLAACGDAAAQAEAAERQAKVELRQRARERAHLAVNRALDNLNKYLKERDRPPKQPRGWPPLPPCAPPKDDPVERGFRLTLDAAMDWWESLRQVAGG
jgi:hypothetical protein